MKAILKQALFNLRPHITTGAYSKGYRKLCVLRLFFQRLCAKISRKKIMHILHIDKCGGTFVMDFFESVDSPVDYKLILNPHDVFLTDVKANEVAMVTLRNPVTRFISGFNCRKRMGKPLDLIPYTVSEEKVFKVFQTADALACALSSDDPHLQALARFGMVNVNHINWCQAKWFPSKWIDLREKSPCLMKICIQESLNSDLIDFCAAFGIDSRAIEEKPRLRESSEPNSALSAVAEENIRRWYSEDYELFHRLRSIGLLSAIQHETLDPTVTAND